MSDFNKDTPFEDWPECYKDAAYSQARKESFDLYVAPRIQAQKDEARRDALQEAWEDYYTACEED